MAAHDFGTDSPHTQKRWANGVEHEVRDKTMMLELAGESDTNIVQVYDELKKEAGDRLRVSLNRITSQDGHVGSATVEGNEGSLEYEYDDIELNELTFSKRWKGRISSQRVAFSRRDDAKQNLSDIWAERQDEVLINHACGYTPANSMGAEGVEYNGNNTIVAPSSTHVIRPNGRTTDDALVSGDDFSLGMVEKVMARIKMMRRADGQKLFRPAYKGKYVWILSPYQVYQLRSDTSTGQYLDINKSILAGGKVEKNPLLTGGLGEYAGCIFLESPFIPNAVESGDETAALPDTRRAVMLGAQALALVYGREGGDLERYTWNEESFNYGKETGIAASAIFGAKKLRFGTSAANSAVDHACFVLATHSPVPA